MPGQVDLNEDTRGECNWTPPILHSLVTDRSDVVLGYDPLIPPQLLQSEIPAVRAEIRSTVMVQQLIYNTSPIMLSRQWSKDGGKPSRSSPGTTTAF